MKKKWQFDKLSCYYPKIYRDRTMADKCCIYPMMLHKITSSVNYNQLLKRFDTQINEPTNQNSTKVPKVVKVTKNKTLL